MNRIIMHGSVDNSDGPTAREKAIAMISHDIRTALSGVTGGLAQIDLAEIDPGLRAILAQTKSSGKHLAELLNAVLAQDALADAEDKNPAPAAVSELLKELDALWRNRAAEKRLSFDIRTGPDCPAALLIDRTGFHRLAGNLLSNAIKFTGSGGIAVHAGSDGAGGFELRVQDSGPGFSESALEKAFEMYGRPASSTVPGTGLGLYIAKSIAEATGGRIEAANLAEGGAEVTVWLPADSGLDGVDATGDGREEKGRDLPDLSGLRILLAEDNATNQLVITQMLRAMNAQPVLASDGVEALAAFEKQDFDLALLDIEMPRVSGLDVIRRIRSRGDSKCDVRLVALTAYAMKDHRERIFSAGADGLIPKPLTSIGELGEQILAFAKHAAQPACRPELPSGTAEGDETPAGGNVVDREIYDALVDAVGPDSMAELLEKVAEDMESVRAGIGEGAAAADPSQIRANTHILVSVAGVIGATKLQSLAESLNAMAKQPSHPDMKTTSEQCVNCITEVLDHIRTNTV
ncbi:MAG: ATP-binding protein [Paracoccaceae bacterium]